MPTFVPPLRDGNPMTSPEATGTQNALMRHYDSWAQGATVWKDSLGVWHESLGPYLGGATHAVHNQWVNGVGPITTTTGPDEGLATAQKVYLGGHVHSITDAEAAELTAAGYGSNLTTLTSIADDFNGPDGDVGADIDWSHHIFNHQPFAFENLGNAAYFFAEDEGSWEDLIVPYPSVDSPHVTQSFALTGLTRTGTGSYWLSVGCGARLEIVSADTDYRGYACEVNRNDQIIPGVDLYGLIIWRVDSRSSVTLLDSDFVAAGSVSLPGTLTFTADGSALSASFAHGGGTLAASVSDSTYSDGGIFLGAGHTLTGTDSGDITIDDYQAGPA